MCDDLKYNDEEWETYEAVRTFLYDPCMFAWSVSVSVRKRAVFISFMMTGTSKRVIYKKHNLALCYDSFSPLQLLSLQMLLPHRLVTDA